MFNPVSNVSFVLIRSWEQGMTLDRVIVNLRDAFEPSQIYVARKSALVLSSLFFPPPGIHMYTQTSEYTWVVKDNG